MIFTAPLIQVMSKGQVKEFERPHHLLQDPSSQFSKMVDKTGPTASQKLRAMAQEAHTRRRGGGGGGGAQQPGGAVTLCCCRCLFNMAIN